VESQEKTMIDGLFGKLQQAESQSPPRDPQAEAEIQNALARQPAAPYYMAQAILVQEQALTNMNQRITELEQELANRPASGGGFLGGLFGAPASAAQQQPQRSALTSQQAAAQGAGNAQFRNAQPNSFLGSAMQTAVGVAGGVLAANLLMGMFSGSDAEAADLPVEDMGAAADEGGFFGDDGGGDDFGGFDD